jgi:hypothetical protein
MKNKFNSLVTKPAFPRLLIQRPHMGFAKKKEVTGNEIAVTPEPKPLPSEKRGTAEMR